MNRYFKAVFCVPLAVVKYLMLKIMNGHRFQGSFPAIISPFTEITCERGSTLYVGRVLKMHNGAKIRVRKGGKLTIGNYFGMSNGCVVTAYDSITIGNNVMLGPNVLIYDQDHDYKKKGGVSAMGFLTSPIKIGNNVWIGANTLILRGTTIGDNCVIAGGSVIRGNYPSDTVIIQKRKTEVIYQNGNTNKNIAGRQ